MKRLLITLMIIASISYSCSDDDSRPSSANVNFVFSHTWDDVSIDNDNLNTINVTNENGELLDFTRIRYLISRFEFTNIEDGTSFLFNGYKFTDLSQTSTYNFSADNNTIPTGRYRLRFVWGFNEADNIDGAYLDLNSASWNWPAPLGGGYHFLQMDGQYNIDSTPSNYNFHNGTARFSENPPVYEQNFKVIDFYEIIEVNDNTSVEVIMNISEFFKNPHRWDLNILDTPLMPNYEAQKMMQDNVETVFSLGEITQN
ncbi:hypothetical protein J4050_01340 [Winogradskyella sp. DF17]|uniref:Copper-binding protein MbnP-like domain-containing protein n=1 Tax=Winogradskyella pelagia TaxID=2819984 RepID=A0ABS3SYR3_9FLAO|nr:MbnP family protein [Winogradskyella sp. DF17]MBO3115369.1 hypothetical protein [Winogradskyella sp. DF17]